MNHATMIWSRIAAELRRHPPRTWLRYPKASVPHPRSAGAHVSVGLPVGQLADYRFPPDSKCRGIHVHEHVHHWVVHLDQVHPECGVGDHVARDATELLYAGGAGLGAIAGLSLGKSMGALLIGAGIGLLIAAMLDAATEANGAERSAGTRT